MGGNPCFALIWLIMLVFIAWPVAGFCAGIWIFLQPFEACFGCIKDCSQFFEKFVTVREMVGHTSTSRIWSHAWISSHSFVLFASSYCFSGRGKWDKPFRIAVHPVLNHKRIWYHDDPYVPTAIHFFPQEKEAMKKQMQELEAMLAKKWVLHTLEKTQWHVSRATARQGGRSWQVVLENR